MRLMIWIKYSKISDSGKLYWGFQWSSWCFELKWSWFMLHVICNTVEYSYIAYCNFRYKIEGIEIKKGFLCLELKSFSSVFVPVLSLVLLWVYLQHPRGKFRNFNPSGSAIYAIFEWWSSPKFLMHLKCHKRERIEPSNRDYSRTGILEYNSDLNIA